ncbi:MAG TPA: PKD domain-containing protein [Chthoniobacterales bacterium]
MKNKRMMWLSAAALSLIMTAIAATNGLAEPAAPILTASVVSQQCQGGDGVNVTLTAVLSPNRSGVLYAWDFNNDGVLDTVPDANPTVTSVYPDEAVETATVSVIKNGRTRLSDSITFQTVRCP